MKKMTKTFFIKGKKKYIYTIELTNLDLVLELRGRILRIWFQILKNKKYRLKFQNKKSYFDHFSY